MDLVSTIYEITNEFLETEKFGLTSQIRHAAVSVPAHIAEGFGWKYTGNYRRFLTISMASLFKFQTKLMISHNLNSPEKGHFKDFL